MRYLFDRFFFHCFIAHRLEKGAASVCAGVTCQAKLMFCNVTEHLLQLDELPL